MTSSHQFGGTWTLDYEKVPHGTGQTRLLACYMRKTRKEPHLDDEALQGQWL